jgi:hypothetical protein
MAMGAYGRCSNNPFPALAGYRFARRRQAQLPQLPGAACPAGLTLWLKSNIQIAHTDFIHAMLVPDVSVMTGRSVSRKSTAVVYGQTLMNWPADAGRGSMGVLRVGRRRLD